MVMEVQGQPTECFDRADGSKACLPVPLSHILADVFSLYQARSPGELMALLRRRYREDATYIDPTQLARPRSEVALCFYAMQHVYTSVRVSDIQSLGAHMTPHGSSPALLQVDAVSRQRLCFARTQPISQQVLPEETTLETSTRLLIEPRTGLVVLHEDRWANKPGLGLPLALRRLSCMCSNGVYRLLGWGRALREAEARGSRWEEQ